MKIKNCARLLLAAFLLCGTTTFTSCAGDEEDVLQETIDVENIYGTWKDKSNQDHWKFNRDGEGVYWDASETTEQQASTGNQSGRFQWSITETGLMRIFWDFETKSFLEKEPHDPAIIEELTATSMVYVTNNGQGTRKYFTKVN